MNATNPDGSVTVTVPLEITVRLASGAVPSAATSVGAALAAAGAGPVRTLTRASEAVKVDADYDNRRGYDEAFIPGNVVALPVMAASLRREIAPLRGNEAGAASGLLRYEHFSLVLHKTRRMAIFTATNIDGATYLSVDRQSGQVGDSEGEKWFKDTRVSDAYTLNQDFYSGWSDYFDRGHLTRRTDPTWALPPKRSAPTPTPSTSPIARRSTFASTRRPSSGRAPSASCWRTACSPANPASAFA